MGFCHKIVNKFCTKPIKTNKQITTQNDSNIYKKYCKMFLALMAPFESLFVINFNVLL